MFFCKKISPWLIEREPRGNRENENENENKNERERERKEREAEEEKCAALIRMQKTMDEYQAFVNKGFEDLKKKYQ